MGEKKNMSITMSGREYAEAIVSDILLRRHQMVAFPFQPDHINRLLFTKKEWYHLCKFRGERDDDGSIQKTWKLKIPFSLFDWAVGAAPYTSLSVASVHGKLYRPPNAILTGSNHEWCIVNDLDRDNKAFPAFEKWAKAQYKIMVDNIAAWEETRFVFEECSTWLQIKKLWPELSQVIQGYKGRSRYIPDIKNRNAKYAHNPRHDAVDRITKHSRKVVPAMVQGNMLPAWEWDRSLWYVNVETRAWYTLPGESEVRVKLGQPLSIYSSTKPL